jgi:hypothetical protein
MGRFQLGKAKGLVTCVRFFSSWPKQPKGPNRSMAVACFASADDLSIGFSGKMRLLDQVLAGRIG